ncbi:hypothetical protein GCM10017691_59430 [Pseudonocardia petroleophila]
MRVSAEDPVTPSSLRRAPDDPSSVTGAEHPDTFGYHRGGAPTPVHRNFRACGTIFLDMTAWLSVLVPLLVMFFALGMERVESKLRESTVRPEELEELLERPRPDEVRALFRQGTGRALELFRLRNRAPRGRRPQKRDKAA